MKDNSNVPKGKKRARNGEGHIRKRKNGRWELQYSINNQNGSLYGDTQDEVKKKFVLLKHELLTGLVTQFEKIKYGDWYELWLNSYKSIQLKPKTLQSYHELFDLYIKNSNIASINIQDLSAHHLQAFINNLIKQNLSSRTVNYTKTVIQGSLNQAVKNGYISKNPAEAVITPRQDKKEPRVLTAEEQKDFMNNLTGNRYKFLFSFALNTGLRTGELLGLQWCNIDFKNKSFIVNRSLNYLKDAKTGKLMLTYGTPKTKKSIRTIPLSNDLTINLLKHKEVQLNEMKKAGDFWLGMNEAHFNENNIFLTEKGLPIYPSTLRHLIGRTIKKINDQRIEKADSLDNVILMKHFSMHTLRHTFATRALECNVPPKVVQEILGHSSITLTLDTYSHVLPSTKQYYMEQIVDVAPFQY